MPHCGYCCSFFTYTVTCFNPLSAHYADVPNESGKRSLVFNSKKGVTHKDYLKIPCGQCIGCRLERSRQWAMRCEHEASLHEENSFITLTYNDENLPHDGSLVKEHFRSFIKRLRRQLDYKYAKKISYYGCGEYGEDQELLSLGFSAIGRPHYHAIIFGHGFYNDRTIHSKSGDNYLYTSKLLDSCWGLGFASVGEMTFESAAYCARYCLKKITGDDAYDHYQKLNPETGEVYLLQPEYQACSTRPAIGLEWFKQYQGDLKKDFVTSRGIKMKPAKYYDRLFEKFDPIFFETIKASRLENVDPLDYEFSGERLLVKQEVKERQIQSLARKLT